MGIIKKFIIAINLSVTREDVVEEINRSTYRFSRVVKKKMTKNLVEMNKRKKKQSADQLVNFDAVMMMTMKAKFGKLQGGGGGGVGQAAGEEGGGEGCISQRTFKNISKKKNASSVNDYFFSLLQQIIGIVTVYKQVF